MRGQLSDQDLNNYALNDGLEPHERLYVESMLAVSQECRDDVYRSLELAQMLETGFERQDAALPCLTAEQRARLLEPPAPRRFSMATVHRAAVTLAIAACAAFALTNPGVWQMENHRRSLASVSSHVTQLVSNTMSADSGLAPLVNFPTLSDEVDSLMQTATDALPQPSDMCTPPSLDASDLLEFR